MMSDEEVKLLSLTALLWNDFNSLADAGKHPADSAEFALRLHDLQRLIMVRSVRRDAPAFFNQL